MTAAMARASRVDSPSRSSRASMIWRSRGGDEPRAELPEGPAVSSRPQRSLRLEGPQHLAGEEGVALGVPLEVGDQPVPVRLRQRPLPHHQLADGGLIQRPEVEPIRPGFADQQGDEGGERMVPIHPLRAVGGDQEERERGSLARQVAEEVEGAAIGPVEVLEDDDDGSLGRRREALPHLGEERVAAAGVAGPVGGGQRRGQRRQSVTGRATGQLSPRAVRRGGGQVVAATCENQGAAGRRFARNRPHQRGLADPGLARDEHKAAAARRRAVETGLQARQLPRAADEPRVAIIGSQGAVHRAAPEPGGLGRRVQGR